MPQIQEWKIPYGHWQSLCYNSLLVATSKGYFGGECPWAQKLTSLLAFSCQTMGRFHGPCEHSTCELLMTPSIFWLFKIGIPFAFKFHRCYDILDFDDFSFPFFYKSSVMKNGLTCPFVIWPKLCITSTQSSWENATIVCTQWRLMITFVFSNNLHCINIIC
jgi:hypothetical protein